MNDLNTLEPGTGPNLSLSERVRELRLPTAPSGNRGGSTASSWLPWTLCVLLALAWGSMGIRSYRTGPAPAATGGAAAPATTATPAAGATADRVTVAPKVGEAGGPAQSNGDPIGSAGRAPSDAVVLEGRGNIIPAHQISVSPVDVVGRIIELNIEEGKSFKEGDILAVIDSTKYQADYDLAVASARAAEARYEEMKISRDVQIDQAEFEVQFSRRTMEKAKNVFEINRRNAENRSKSISEMELMQSEKEYQGTTLQVSIAERKRELIKGRARDEMIKAAEQDWRSAQARAAQARWFLNNCTIKAPVTGIILTKKAERGNLINPVVGGVSTNLCEIADLSDLEVDLEIQERDLKKFYVGQACRVKADAYPERVYEAFVDRAMPIANRAKGVLPVRIKIVVPPTEEQGKYLKPEMGVTVYFLDRNSSDPKWLAKPNASPVAVSPTPEKAPEKTAPPAEEPKKN